MKNKPFDKKLWKKHDPKSRTIVKRFFKDRGLILKDHQNEYDLDLISEDGKVKVEVEHRLVWKTNKFPFSLINVPRRKDKFFKSGDTHYCILSEKYDYLAFIHKDKISKYMEDKYLKEVSNKYIREGEYFYQIPREEFEYYEIN